MTCGPSEIALSYRYAVRWCSSSCIPLISHANTRCPGCREAAAPQTATRPRRNCAPSHSEDCARLEFTQRPSSTTGSSTLLILSEFDIQFRLPAPAAMVALLHLHPSLEPRLRSGNELVIEALDNPFDHSPGSTDYTKSTVPSREYLDAFGNRCARFVAPAGYLWLSGSNIIDADAERRSPASPARGRPPSTTCRRRCCSSSCPAATARSTSSARIAQDLFGHYARAGNAPSPSATGCTTRSPSTTTPPAPPRPPWTCSPSASACAATSSTSPSRSTRCQNIPARYVTGYIGDIRRPFSGPGDFSAWYQVFLDGQWIDLDARHNYRRLGRILMATGRDAADVAITTSFGAAPLTHFSVDSNEVDAKGEQGSAAALQRRPGRLARARGNRTEHAHPEQSQPVQPHADAVGNLVAKPAAEVESQSSARSSAAAGPTRDWPRTWFTASHKNRPASLEAPEKSRSACSLYARWSSTRSSPVDAERLVCQTMQACHVASWSLPSALD